MEGVCTKCKISERYQYWHEFPATKHKFFKVMVADFEHQLRFPNKFIECFKGHMARECTLRGPSRSEWRARIDKTDDDQIVLSDGWENFVRDNGVMITDFLTFRYVGNSSFKVSIFDPTGCERESSHFAKNMSSSSNVTCGSSLHCGENGGFECLFDPPDACEMKGEEEEEEEEEESSLGGDEEEDYCYRPRKSSRGGLSHAKQPQMQYTSNRRRVSWQEKNRAHHMALRLKSSKPSGMPMFDLTMCQSHVYKGFHLTIPKKWAMEHMFRNPHEVELKVPGTTKTWSVGCSWTPSQCQIRSQWPIFVLENTLEEHDVCVFELIEKLKMSAGRRKTVFMVHIFRVVDEIVPLTVSRSVV